LFFARGYEKGFGGWSLEFIPEILRVFAWTKDFVLASMKLIKTQSWVYIHGLPLDYWQSKAIFSIACGIDTPLSLDDYTKNKS